MYGLQTIRGINTRNQTAAAIVARHAEADKAKAAAPIQTGSGVSVQPAPITE